MSRPGSEEGLIRERSKSVFHKLEDNVHVQLTENECPDKVEDDTQIEDNLLFEKEVTGSWDSHYRRRSTMISDPMRDEEHPERSKRW